MWTPPSLRIVRRHDLATWQDLDHQAKVQKNLALLFHYFGILPLVPPLWAAVSKSSALLQPHHYDCDRIVSNR